MALCELNLVQCIAAVFDHAFVHFLFPAWPLFLTMIIHPVKSPTRMRRASILSIHGPWECFAFAAPRFLDAAWRTREGVSRAAVEAQMVREEEWRVPQEFGSYAQRSPASNSDGHRCVKSRHTFSLLACLRRWYDTESLTSMHSLRPLSSEQVCASMGDPRP